MFIATSAGRDLRGRRGAQRRSRAEHSGGAGPVCREPAGVRSRGAGGDWELLGGRADPGGACRSGGCGQPGGHRDRAGAREDRTARRAHVGPIAVVGELESVWMPDERCRVLRRRLARREQLVHGRTRAKNEIHAVLQRRLQGKPPCADLFGIKGRHWLAELELPLEERESVEAGLRQIDFLDGEVAAVERLIAQQALEWPDRRRLMTVPGVNLICAASFMAAIGDPTRFFTSRKLVAYLGLDPKVRQSGEAPARSGRISKRGSAAARWALVEAAWSVVLQPGPLHAFYARDRAGRGAGQAIV